MYRNISKPAGVAVALFAAAALVPTLSLATMYAAAAPTKSEIVKYADLDLTRPADAKVLVERIRVAAHEVCTMNTGDAARICYRDAVHRAVKQVNKPLVSASL